jgi:hypothetical protein
MPVVAAEATPASPASLPRTGFPVLGVLGLGIGLLVAGFGLFAAGGTPNEAPAPPSLDPAGGSPRGARE